MWLLIIFFVLLFLLRWVWLFAWVGWRWFAGTHQRSIWLDHIRIWRWRCNSVCVFLSISFLLWWIFLFFLFFWTDLWCCLTFRRRRWLLGSDRLDRRWFVVLLKCDVLRCRVTVHFFVRVCVFCSRVLIWLRCVWVWRLSSTVWNDLNLYSSFSSTYIMFDIILNVWKQSHWSIAFTLSVASEGYNYACLCGFEVRGMAVVLRGV